MILAEPDWTYGSGGSRSITTKPAFWDHGAVAADVDSIWIGLAGPGVPRDRVSWEWVDGADILPTLQRLVTGTLEPGLEGLAMVDAPRRPPASRAGAAGPRPTSAR